MNSRRRESQSVPLHISYIEEKVFKVRPLFNAGFVCKRALNFRQCKRPNTHYSVHTKCCYTMKLLADRKSRRTKPQNVFLCAFFSTFFYGGIDFESKFAVWRTRTNGCDVQTSKKNF